MDAWADGYWWSKDGLRLHYRDYPGDPAALPVLCLHGLTRNARDFEGLAAHLNAGRRVIVPEMRGRGESAYAKDSMSYVPLIYLQDLAALFDQLALPRFLFVGTSMGGILTMLVAATDRSRVAGAVLNDIGPVVEEAGLERIRSYVGRSASWPTWMHAARDIADAQGGCYPGWKLDDWLLYAKRLCRLTGAGRIVWDYDMKIAEPMRLPGGEGAVDLWPAFTALAATPLLVVRGGTSDILSAETLAEIERRAPATRVITVPRTGHAPTLDEPEVVAAIDALVGQAI